MTFLNIALQAFIFTCISIGSVLAFIGFVMIPIGVQHFIDLPQWIVQIWGAFHLVFAIVFIGICVGTFLDGQI